MKAPAIGSIFRYTAAPQILPRLRALAGSGFEFTAYFVALVYAAVRLLPANHPYLQSQNIGRFGIRHVVAEAANNLILRWQNIDQIILFACILLGIVIALMQIIALGMAVFMGPAIAAMPTHFGELFTTPNPKDDLAFMMMDMVFGIPDLFNSCVSLAELCVDMNGNPVRTIQDTLPFPYPIHTALHNMFLIYNSGLMVVAVLITSYFVVTVVAETAQTGTPFGKRFEKVWAPLRIVFAFGLLMPLSLGLNSAQYIVFYAAKYGSGFATNGWILFNENLLGEYADQVSEIGSAPVETRLGGTKGQSLIAVPNIPEVGDLLQFMYVARTCAEAYRLKSLKNDIQPYLVKNSSANPNHIPITHKSLSNPFDPIEEEKAFDKVLSGEITQAQYDALYGIDAFDRGIAEAKAHAAASYEDMRLFADGQTQVLIRFGERKEGDEKYAKEKGGVAPICGDLVFKLPDPRPSAPGAVAKSDQHLYADPGAEIMQRYYWYLIKELWFEVLTGKLSAIGLGEKYPENLVRTTMQIKPNPNAKLADDAYRVELQQFYEQDLGTVISGENIDPAIVDAIGSNIGAIPAQQNSGRWSVDANMLRKGWGAAGIWYNRIAELNGTISTSILAVPYPAKYPMIMEKVYEDKKQNDQIVDMAQRYNPKLADGKIAQSLTTADQEDAVAGTLWKSFEYWKAGGQVNTSHTAITGNAFIDAVNAFFGTSGLFSMRKNEDVHPMAQMVGVGRSLIESTIRNTIFSAGGSIVGAMEASVSDFASIGISFTFAIIVASATMGFVLFYVLPFMPFIYFFFALSGWVKGIFEALIGAPLWALAHIRIDGNGLPGQAAVNGYFLIFEIFLRPILIVFGLLASISTFSALVAMLNDVWDLVTSNLTGFDIQTELQAQKDGNQIEQQLGTMRSSIDKFFFTIVYTVVVYLMGMASFKLIDLIPNNILRWMGQAITTFNDEKEDPAKSLGTTATIGANQALESVGGGVQQALQETATLSK